MKIPATVFALAVAASSQVATPTFAQSEKSESTIGEMNDKKAPEKARAQLKYSDECITEQDVVEAQKAWGDGIVKIGKIYSEDGDYEAAASAHINDYYA